MNSFDQAGTAPRVGLIELPDLADLLARSGVAVVSGANFREAATNVKEASASSPLPLIIGDRPTSEDGRPAPGINMWSKKMSAQHRVAVIRNHTEKHLDIENAVEITLPTTVNTILAALGMQPLAADAAYPAGAQAAPAAAPEAAPAESAAPGFFDAPAPAQQLEAPAPADFYAAPAPAQQFEAPAAPAVPADFYAAPAPAPQFEAPAPAAPAVPADFYAAPAPAPQFEAPAPADFYAAPAPAQQFEAPAPAAPADFYAAPAPQFEAPAPAAPAVPADFYAAPAPAQQFEAPAPAAPADFYAAPAPAQQFEAPVPVPDFSAAPSPAAAMQFETPAPAAPSAGDFFNAAPAPAPQAPAPQAPAAPAAGSFYAPPAPAQQFEAPAPAPGDFFNAPGQGQFAAAPAQQFDAPAPAPGDFFNAPGQGQFGAPAQQFDAPAPAPGDFFNAPGQGQFGAPAQQFDAPAPAPAPAPGDFFNAPAQGQFAAAPAPAFTASEDAFFGGPSVPAAPARGNAPAAPMVQQMPMDVSESFDSHQAARRRSAGHSTTHLANVIVCIAGKGGVGKTTTAVSLAQIAAEAGLRVILIDGNVGQADLRTYLRTANSDLPTIYDAAIGRESAIVSPGQLNGVRRPEQGQVKFGFVAGPPHDSSVDQYVVTNQDYIKVIQEARQKVDLVILDTQILEARDDSHFVSDVIQPLLVESAFALGIADMTTPGVERLNERLVSLINHGTPRDRIMIMINNVPPGEMVVADNGQRYFDKLGNFVGAVPTNVAEIHDVMNAGSVPSNNVDLRTVLTDVLARATGADVFNAVPEESEPSAEAKGGLFSRMFKKKAA